MTFSHLAIQITVICIIKEGQFRRGMFKQVHVILYHSRMHALVKTDMRKNCVVCVYTQSEANLMVCVEMMSYNLHQVISLIR